MSFTAENLAEMHAFAHSISVNARLLSPSVFAMVNEAGRVHPALPPGALLLVYSGSAGIDTMGLMMLCGNPAAGFCVRHLVSNMTGGILMSKRTEGALDWVQALQADAPVWIHKWPLPKPTKPWSPK